MRRKPAAAAIALALVGMLTLWAGGCSTEKAATPAGGEEGARGDIRTLPAGEAVDLAKRSVHGKITIFDFYAEWCSPCALITPRLEKLVRSRPDELALRKVDVIGWGSDAAMHQGIEYLPYLAVVDADGTVAATGDDSYTYLKEHFGLDLVTLILDGA